MCEVIITHSVAKRRGIRPRPGRVLAIVAFAGRAAGGALITDDFARAVQADLAPPCSTGVRCAV